MKRYFSVTNDEGLLLAVFLYTSDEKADSLIMQIICEHYGIEDCELDNGFRIGEYKYRPISIKSKIPDECECDVSISEVAIYGEI
jgi:hypothetical protein